MTTIDPRRALQPNLVSTGTARPGYGYPSAAEVGLCAHGNGPFCGACQIDRFVAKRQDRTVAEPAPPSLAQRAVASAEAAARNAETLPHGCANGIVPYQATTLAQTAADLAALSASTMRRAMAAADAAVERRVDRMYGKLLTTVTTSCQDCQAYISKSQSQANDGRCLKCLLAQLRAMPISRR